ncbi:aldo/keto reductase [Actinophytocola xanthii]|nr:aldo/keto reductase [Actinophytocola xanthii]
MTAAPEDEPVLPVGTMSARRLGIGSLPLAGPGAWGSTTSPDRAMCVLMEAVDVGVGHVDTADAWGPHIVETYVANAVHSCPAGVRIATKGGLTRPGPGKAVPCGRPEYLRQCVETSLRRLRVERIDLYYLHRVDLTVPFEAQLEVLAELQADGKIGEIGLCKVGVDQVVRARRVVDIAAVQASYNLAHRANDDVLRYCEDHDIPFVAVGALGGGLLTQRDGVLAAVAASYDATPAQLAIAALLNRSPVITPILSTGLSEHLRELLRAPDLRLTPDDVGQITVAVDEALAARGELASAGSERFLYDLLEPLLIADGRWQVVDAGWGTGTARREWPDGTVDSLFLVASGTTQLTRTYRGKDLIDPIQGIVTDVVHQVLQLPEPCVSAAEGGRAREDAVRRAAGGITNIGDSGSR